MKNLLVKVSTGWGAGIRTPIGRSRVGSPTIERHPNLVRGVYDTLALGDCQAYVSTKLC